MTDDDLNEDTPSGDAAEERVELLPPSALPDELWTIRYDYGTPFSYGPIGQEAVWLFESEEVATDAIQTALETEPDAGVLTADRVTIDEIRDRFALAVYIDNEGHVWPMLTTPPADLSETPLPDEPFALFTAGGGIDRYHEEAREGDWVVHRDDDSETDYVLFFEDMDTAQQVLEEFIEATDEQAEVRRTRAETLQDNQGVRYYHANGQIEDLPRKEYLRRCR